MIYKAIVFLPIVGALIAGFSAACIGPRPSELITTSFVGIAAVLSWVVFWQVGFGGETRARRRCCAGSPRASSTSPGRCASTR